MKTKKMRITKENKNLAYGIMIGVFFVIIFLFPDAFKEKYINPMKDSQIVSFIGANIGTILSFLSIFVLYLTLKNQRKSSQIEKFENKFFELIKLHRDNVCEVELKGQCGRKVFVVLIREYREIYEILKKLLSDTPNKFDKEEILNISYLIFYYGVGPNSSRILRNALPNKYDCELIDTILNTFDDCKLKSRVKANRGFSYTPFEGHQSRLGHYYRHLYQTITYVDKQSIKIDKYSYVKILRAQLSNHEQALLFFNVLSDLGVTWREEDLITKYSFIKNLPENFIDKDSEIDVKAIFPKLKFEWEN
jgi:hypothetical protein